MEMYGARCARHAVVLTCSSTRRGTTGETQSGWLCSACEQSADARHANMSAEWERGGGFFAGF